MTDLEITKLCAEAMEFAVVDDYAGYNPPVAGVAIEHPGSNDYVRYDPLHDDAQAMALVKKLGLSVSGPTARDKDREFYVWCAYEAKTDGELGQSRDLNRAICECVAAMQVRARQES